jgi:hypothetical protein
LVTEGPKGIQWPFDWQRTCKEAIPGERQA